MYAIVFLSLYLSLLGIVQSDINCTGANTLITFDDLPATSKALIPDTYYDLFWSHAAYLPPAQYTPPNGYYTALSSGLYVAYNGDALPMTISSPANSTFNIISFIAAAAWNDNLTMSMNGVRNRTTVYQKTVTLQTTNSSFIVLNWTDINAITFNTSGGTLNPMTIARANGTHFAMDNLCIDVSSFYVPTLYPMTTTAPNLILAILPQTDYKILIIVLSVVFGVAIIAAIGVTAYCCIKCRRGC